MSAAIIAAQLISDSSGRDRPDGVPVEIMRPLIYRYGSQILEVLKYLDENLTATRTIASDLPVETPSSRVLKAEVLYAIRSEMAQRLTDLVFRRTELGIVRSRPDESLMSCAAIMAAEMKWDRVRSQQEIDKLRTYLGWDNCCDEQISAAGKSSQ